MKSKFSFYLFFFNFFSVSVFGGGIMVHPLRPAGTNAYPFESKTLVYEVLGVNFDKNEIAFRHLYQIEGKTFGEPVNCQYAGMQAYPKAGVILGFYNTMQMQGSVSHWFPVYRSVDSKKKCVSFQESRKTLMSAVRRLYQNKITPQSRLKPLQAVQEKTHNGVLIRLPTSSGKREFLLQNFRGNEVKESLGNEDSSIPVFLRTEFREERFCEKDDFCKMTIGVLSEKGNPIRIRYQEDEFSMASGGSHSFVEAFEESDGQKNRLLFHMNFRHQSHGATNDVEHHYFFRPL